MDIVWLLFRLVLAAAMLAHAASRLAPRTVETSAGFLEGAGYPNGYRAAQVLGGAEGLAGLLIASGFLTLVGAGVAIATLLVSLVVRGGRTPAGYAAALMVVALILTYTGAGALSVDGVMGADGGGINGSLLGVFMGLLGAGAMLSLRRPGDRRAIASHDHAVNTSTQRVA